MQAPPKKRSIRLVPLLAGAAITALLLLVSKSSSGARQLEQGVDLDGAAAGGRVAAWEAAGSRWPKTRVINDLETLWEVPAKPKGVLFVAHGCNHQGSDFWLPSPRCRHCLGLPEEGVVRATALKRGCAVVAVTSFNRDSKCWHNTQPSRSEDLKRLPAILLEVMEEEQLQGLPLYALGGSSGGSIVLRLAQIMPEVQGVISQITPVNPSIFKLDKGAARSSFPPVLFVHMAQRDPEKAETVAEALRICKKAGTPAAEVRVAPRPVTPQFLQRAPQISAKVAKDIVAALRRGGLIDKEGFLKKDPRSTGFQWRELLAPVVGDLRLESDVSQVAELFNVAWARHELVGDTTDLSLRWLEAGGKKSPEELGI